MASRLYLRQSPKVPRMRKPRKQHKVYEAIAAVTCRSCKATLALNGMVWCQGCISDFRASMATVAAKTARPAVAALPADDSYLYAISTHMDWAEKSADDKLYIYVNDSLQ